MKLVFSFHLKNQLNMKNILIAFFAVLFSLNCQELQAQSSTDKETIENICKNKWFLRRYESPTQFYTTPVEYQGTYMVFLPNGKLYYHKKGENEATKPRYDYKIYDGKISTTSHEGEKEVFDFRYGGYNVYFTIRSGSYAGITYTFERSTANVVTPQTTSTTNSSTSSTQDNSDFEFDDVDDLANQLNKDILFGRINFQPPSYKFNSLGKTDFDRSSLEFVTRNNQMYLRMNLPKNGTCDYGLKETKAILSGQYGSGGGQFYIAFKYNYACNSVEYSTIYATFKWKSKAHHEATIAAAKRFLK